MGKDIFHVGDAEAGTEGVETHVASDAEVYSVFGFDGADELIASDLAELAVGFIAAALAAHGWVVVQDGWNRFVWHVFSFVLQKTWPGFAWRCVGRIGAF